MKRMYEMSPELEELIARQKPAREYPLPGEFSGFEREELSFELISYHRSEEGGGYEYLSFSGKVRVIWDPYLVESTGRVRLVPRLLPQQHTEILGGVDKKYKLEKRVLRRLKLRQVPVELPDAVAELPAVPWLRPGQRSYYCFLWEARPMAADIERQLRRILNKPSKS